MLKNIALGAAAGFAGTVALQVLRTASERWAPGTMAPIRQDPGQFMVDKAEQQLSPQTRQRIPQTLETTAAQSLAVGYGLTFGALYALAFPRGGPLLLRGAVLGLLTWAAGYLGRLPALRLMPPVSRQSTCQLIGPAARHAAYGIATAAAHNWLEHNLSPTGMNT